ncbi:hypothetical protein [Marilutibacter aestuarii]|nr:hypothetical protein [Lysobacter aestuarii]
MPSSTRTLIVNARRAIEGRECEGDQGEACCATLVSRRHCMVELVVAR